MAETKTTERLRVAEVIERYGSCLELVTMDTKFHDISVSLYEKGGHLYGVELQPEAGPTG